MGEFHQIIIRKLPFSLLKQHFLNTSDQFGDGCVDDCGKDCVFSFINTIDTTCDLVFYSRKYKMLAYKLCGV
jgi:hypothetical protein